VKTRDSLCRVSALSKVKVKDMFQSIPVLTSVFGFLVVYALVVFFMFRRNDNGMRRRWEILDFVWVPLGGATGICLLALWWHTHGPIGS
jgi:hypothetical protein